MALLARPTGSGKLANPWGDALISLSKGADGQYVWWGGGRSEGEARAIWGQSQTPVPDMEYFRGRCSLPAKSWNSGSYDLGKGQGHSRKS